MTRICCADNTAMAGHRGFTMLELLAAVTIIGLLLAVAVPASARFYESMQYRQAVRDVITALASARYAAVSSGRARDVSIDPATNSLALNGESTHLPAGLHMAVHATRELNRARVGVIRYYPEGGSSGGDIDLERDNGTGVRISVDWLLGHVTQETYAPD